MEGFDLDQIGGPHLPQLPDLDELRETAQKRREFFSGVVQRAQVEVDNAQRILDGLDGRAPSRVRSRRRGSGPRSRLTGDSNLSDAVYLQVLAKLASHNYASAKTLGAGIGVSDSSARRAGNIAVRQGHATIERRGKKHRFTITAAGRDWVARNVNTQGRPES